MPYLDLAGPFLYGGALLMVRVALVVSMLPGLSETAVPRRVRLIVVLSLTIVLNAMVGGVSLPVPESVPVLFVMVMRELMIGFGLGMSVRLIMAAVEAAGEIIGLSMALAASALFDPRTGEQNTTIGTLLGMAAALIFVALDGHHHVIVVFHQHLDVLPVGQTTIEVPSLATLVEAIGDVALTALKLAAPVVVVGLFLNVGLALISRVVPSVNLFGMGLSILIMGGLLALGGEGEAILAHVEEHIAELPERMASFVGAL